MSEEVQAGDSTEELPESYHMGEELDWDAPSVPVVLFVELPYWLMVSDCSLQVEVRGCTFQVDVRNRYNEAFAAEVTDSRRSRVYIGPPGIPLSPDIQQMIDEKNIPTMQRKCKTVDCTPVTRPPIKSTSPEIAVD